MKQDSLIQNNLILTLVKHSFFSKRRANRSLIIAIIGVTIGIFSLISILGTMNGMQDLLIKHLIKIEAYNFTGRAGLADLNSKIELTKQNSSIKNIVPFVDEYAFLESIKTSKVIHLRALLSTEANKDTDFLNALSLTKYDQTQYFEETKNKIPGIIIGWNLSGIIQADKGDILNLSFPGEGAGFLPLTIKVKVTEVFYSGSDYDTNWALMSLEDYVSTQKELKKISYGIRAKENSVTHNFLKNNFEGLASWKENNSAFYIALKTEKSILFILSTVIFCIIIIHFRFSMMRRIRNKKDDIVALRTMGLLPNQIQSWFLGETVAIGILGTLFGIILGLAFVYGYPYLYEWVFINFGISIDMGNLTGGSISLYEIIIILALSWITLLWSSWNVVKKSATIAPAQVLRFE